MEALKITEKIIRENAPEHKKKKPGLSANRPPNNRALVLLLPVGILNPIMFHVIIIPEKPHKRKGFSFLSFHLFSKIRYHFYLFTFELYVNLCNTYSIEYSLKNDTMLLSLSGICVLSSSAYQRSKTQEHDCKTILTPCLS